VGVSVYSRFCGQPRLHNIFDQYHYMNKTAEAVMWALLEYRAYSLYILLVQNKSFFVPTCLVYRIKGPD
jgi:hypothetical protein